MNEKRYCQECGAELIRSISLEPRMVIENELKYDSRTGRKITWVSYRCPAIRGGLLGWLDYGIHTEYVQELKDNNVGNEEK
jgi:hypothetical protein